MNMLPAFFLTIRPGCLNCSVTENNGPRYVLPFLWSKTLDLDSVKIDVWFTDFRLDCVSHQVCGLRILDYDVCLTNSHVCKCRTRMCLTCFVGINNYWTWIFVLSVLWLTYSYIGPEFLSFLRMNLCGGHLYQYDNLADWGHWKPFDRYQLNHPLGHGR